MAEKQLKIKLNVLKRNRKDYVYYKKEFATNQAKVEKMKADNKDVHDVKQQEQVLQETESMLPDCEARIRTAKADLASFMEDNKEEIAESPLLEEAQLALQEK